MSLFKKNNKKNSHRRRYGVGLVAISRPYSKAAECFRTLWVSIKFAVSKKLPKVIAFTSAETAEGKSLVSANVAATWANHGKRILLIDTNLRRPSLHKIFALNNSKGLTSILIAQKADLNDYIQQTSIDNLYVLPSGSQPMSPGNLLDSPQMDKLMQVLSDQFDVIILDTPAVNEVADTRILASKVTGVVLVVAQNHVSKEAVIKAKSALEQAHANILGVVLNRANTSI